MVGSKYLFVVLSIMLGLSLSPDSYGFGKHHHGHKMFGKHFGHRMGHHRKHRCKRHCKHHFRKHCKSSHHGHAGEVIFSSGPAVNSSIDAAAARAAFAGVAGVNGVEAAALRAAMFGIQNSYERMVMAAYIKYYKSYDKGMAYYYKHRQNKCKKSYCGVLY